MPSNVFIGDPVNVLQFMAKLLTTVWPVNIVQAVENKHGMGLLHDGWCAGGKAGGRGLCCDAFELHSARAACQEVQPAANRYKQRQRLGRGRGQGRGTIRVGAGAQEEVHQHSTTQGLQYCNMKYDASICPEPTMRFCHADSVM